MADVKYEDEVRLLRPGMKPEDMTLADAVRAIVGMSLPDRLKATIVTDGKPIATWAEVRAIYERPDFPTHPHGGK